MGVRLREISLVVKSANAQGTAGIERTLLSANPDLTLRSTGLLPVVLGIEGRPCRKPSLSETGSLLRSSRFMRSSRAGKSITESSCAVSYTHLRPALRQTHLLPPGTSHLQTLGD